VIVAIDGPAGSGKSTTARSVAARLGFFHINTGAMYRAVALAFLRLETAATPEGAAALLPALKLDVRYEQGRQRLWLDGEDVTDALNHPDVGRMASRVATLAPVRERLVAEQRRLGRRYGADPGVVLEGRDIGTVVFPEAHVKIFMVADPAVRAQRRQDELAASGTHVSIASVLEEIQERDRQDRQRALSPLRRAPDAIELDTTHRSIEAQVQFVVDRVRERDQAGLV